MPSASGCARRSSPAGSGSRWNPEDQRTLLRRLSETEGFEQYLRRSFLGQKQFSLEGLESLVPMLDAAVALAAAGGAHEVVIGMAHRGRLNALVHTVGRSYQEILREFEGERSADALVVDPEGGSGDVKYHLPASGTRLTEFGEIDVVIVPNPSHLEAADPVVEGRARAEQTDRSSGAGIHDPAVALPVLIHGDAAFPGQGVVAETLNLQSLEGYSTGGTLHLITNNQIGYTTDPTESRSTRYSSDLAKGFDVPIVHVNADDPEAAVSAVRLALAYRAEFGHDFVIDLVGYRRFGHNEQDDASYTQPLMVERILRQPTARALYAERLVAEGVVTQDEAERYVADVTVTLRRAHEQLESAIAAAKPAAPPADVVRVATTGDAVVTAVDADRLRVMNEQLLAVPDGFTINAKLSKQLDRRYERIEHGGIDWGQSEALAYATLLEDGIPVRLSGQDAERGTFAHRHLVFHDPYTGETYAPIQNLPGSAASFEVYNSPLSEYAALGFEYGYSVAAPDALVLWEAQYGDFVNGAQIVIDQFLVAGRSKWGQTSRLTLLLPHGYEGNGPEHSSARLERFLQQGAQDNIRIANCTTAAQFFHLLRRQALDATARPLIVMTPKGLLRLKQASSTLADLAAGAFRPIIPDEGGRSDATRLILCSGKIYYDIVGHDEHANAARRRGRAHRAAVPVSPRRRRRADRGHAAPRGGRLGAGGAAEHGRLAVDKAPARRGGEVMLLRRERHLCRPFVESIPERGLSDGPPARAGSHRPVSARRSARLTPAGSAARLGSRASFFSVRCACVLSRPQVRRLRRVGRGRALHRGAGDAARVEACATGRRQRGLRSRGSGVAAAALAHRARRPYSDTHPRPQRAFPRASGRLRFQMEPTCVVPSPVPEPGGSMPVDSDTNVVESPFASVIQDHLELKKQNAELNGEMPLDRYQIEDPFENHPLFKSEEQARIEETLDGEPAVELHSLALPWPGEETAENAAPPGEPTVDDDLWGRSRDFDWGE